MSSAEIVAIALLTREDLQTFGGSLQRAYPIEEVPHFDELIRQIDALYPRAAERAAAGNPTSEPRDITPDAESRS